MISIEATQTFFSGLGVAFCILSFITVFIPSKTKFGIIALCLGNIPLWSAIVMPKSLPPILDFFKVNQSTNCFMPGCIAGVICLILWYFLTSKIMAFYKLKFRSDSEAKSSDGDDSESADNKVKAYNSDAIQSNGASANPHLFDNLKINDKD